MRQREWLGLLFYWVVVADVPFQLVMKFIFMVSISPFNPLVSVITDSCVHAALRGRNLMLRDSA